MSGFGLFKSQAERDAWHAEWNAAHADLAMLRVRAEAKQAIEIAQRAADAASILPLGSDAAAAIAVVVKALAIAAGLVR